MAEFPDAGQHCSLSTCQQLDFLPIVCVGCRDVFCKLHSPFDAHQCRHRPNVEIKEVTAKQSSPPGAVCKFDGCDTAATDLNPLVECRTCGLHFCMDHRNELDHQCTEKIPADGSHVMQKTRETVSNILSKAVEKKPDKKVSTKNLKMAAKVQLMKLKQSSDGSKAIPANERVYFRVHFWSAKSDRPSSKNVFVSSKWSVGLIIDKIADLCQVGNSNNSSMATKKLRIFNHQTGELWSTSTNLSENLESLLSSENAFNGESLILESTESFESLTEEIFSRYKDLK